MFRKTILAIAAIATVSAFAATSASAGYYGYGGYGGYSSYGYGHHKPNYGYGYRYGYCSGWVSSRSSHERDGTGAPCGVPFFCAVLSGTDRLDAKQ